MNEHLMILLELPAVDSAQEVGALIRVDDDMVNNVSSIEALGVKPEIYSDVFPISAQGGCQEAATS
ncbi:hypothetical protein HPB48_021200 [Haemaphysalis longicornis]|uniref:Uncharacterized protein n=1 Tax=Haemaphysalis longicornis TaxID=44386 RepID=A0A9J6GU85_HAELO|nr:hypothetical protein HPB48_021200 [Haemaphysalis longicornis]